jgi:N-acetylmuramic acid 6-phosphate etherase
VAGKRVTRKTAAKTAFVGVDAGGTKLRAAVVRSSGELVAHFEAPGTNLAIDGFAVAASRIADPVRQALAERRAMSVVVGIAGASNHFLARALERELAHRLDAKRVRVRADAVALLEALPKDGNRLVLAAGTGAVLFGRDRSGKLYRVDGWGPTAGDAGSGYYIGRRALDAALRGHDGRAKRPSFGRALLSELAIVHPERDIANLYADRSSQARVAALVPLVVRAAERGDRLAQQILEDAGNELGSMLAAIVARMPRAPATLTLTGSLLRHVPQLRERVLQAAADLSMRIDAGTMIPEAILVLNALRLAKVAISDAQRNALLEKLARHEPRRVERAARREAVSVTEAVNPATASFSFESPERMVALMNAEDQRVAPTVARILPQLARAVEQISARLERGGRMIYVGAGTSGRLGVLDASEVPPTFGEDPNRIQAVIAGGARALSQSVEGAEDRADAGESEMTRLRVGPKDAVVGLSVSGSAPFVLGAIRAAKKKRALTLAITCNGESKLAASVALPLVVEVGPEVIAGSSRLKAGTAQKLILNILSTCTMARLGRVTGNLMTHVATSNQKLRARATRIASEVLGVSEAEAKARLRRADWQLDAILGSGAARGRR